MNKYSAEYQLVKLTIDRVKNYAKENHCKISDACGPNTGISRKSYDEGINLMIRMGYRDTTYNEVEIPWDDIDVIKNYIICGRFPHLYQDVVNPEVILRKQNDHGMWYRLSDEAYDEWYDYVAKEKEYKKSMVCPCG